MNTQTEMLGIYWLVFGEISSQGELCNSFFNLNIQLSI